MNRSTGVRGNIDRINEQANRCMEISRRYLGFLRNEHSEAGDVDVNQILADLEELMRKHKAMADNTLEIELLEDDARPMIHGTDLIQILLNLTINALQATDRPHTARVCAHLLEKPLDIASYPDTDSLRLIHRYHFPNHPPLLALTVEDDGPGIPPSHIRKNF